MQMKKNVLRAVACAAASAVMAAMILTACGSSGAPASSGSNGTGNSGAASSTPASSSSSTGSSTGSGCSSGTTAAKATKILQYANGAVQAEYTTQKDGSSIVNHYLCAVSGENVYVLTYDNNNGKASTAFVRKDGTIYAIDGNYMSKAPSASGMISTAKTGCNFPTTAEAATMTTGKYTVNGREYDAEILKKSVYGNAVSYIYCFEGNVLKYRVVSGLYYDTSKNPINEVTTYKSISTKVDAKLFDLSNYSLIP